MDKRLSRRRMLDANPIFFLHGFLGTPKDWDPLFSFLSLPSYSALPLPGHCHTPFSPHFLPSTPGVPFSLVGYSMGGRLALRYAAQHPRNVKKLVLISTHPGLRSPEEKKERRNSDALWARLLCENPIDEFLQRWYDQPIFNGFKPDFSMRRDHDPLCLAQSLLHYGLGKQPFLSNPKAVHIVGEKDAKFRAIHPDALIVPNAAHAVHLENPAYLATLLREIFS